MLRTTRYPRIDLDNRFHDPASGYSYDVTEVRGIYKILICLRDVESPEKNIIAGSRKTSLWFGRRVELIPETKKEKIKSKLLSCSPKQLRERTSLEFWDKGYCNKRLLMDIYEYFS